MLPYLDQNPSIDSKLLVCFSATHTHTTWTIPKQTTTETPTGSRNQKDAEANVGKSGGEIDHFATAFYTIKNLGWLEIRETPLKGSV